MPERSVNSALRSSLLSNDAFAYAHLVKFEKPSLTSQVEGATSGKATDYAYITDASQDILFNDGSTDSQGNANGIQVYRANKLISVGTVSETTEARASNMAIKLYATTLGTSASDSFAISSGSLAGDTDLSAEGFQEGDKILLTGSGANTGKYVIINAFSNSGKTIAVTPVDTTLSSETATYTLSLASEELTALLLDKSATGYASFLNREVFVYKAHLSPEDNSIVGEPYLVFKGIVSNGSIDEKPDATSTVSWNLTSHWGDFVQVRGRITSDAFHRALDPSGRPDRDGLIRREYGNDLGFLHSEKAINIISTYQVKETRYRKQTKSGFLGFNKKISLIPYDVEVDREVDLRFNMQAKYLPVVYGVQRVDSIPVFADTLLNDSKEIYVAYAISEGELGGIYDIYIDDTPSICTDKNDFATRSGQTDEQTIDVVCKGRADKGDVLGGTSYFSGALSNGLLSQTLGFEFWNPQLARDIGNSLTALSGVDFNLFDTGATTTGTGIQHEKGHYFSTPIDSYISFHTGKPFQKANSVLSSVASAGNFKIQNDYYDNEADYWGPSHRLLDTAYAVGKYTISESETQIPELDFVVRGKLIECYNYDYSYSPDLKNDSSHDHTNFDLLDSVTLHNTTTNAQIGSSVKIIDKWSFADASGNTQYRFRFSTNPSLGSVKTFYMKNSSGDRWYFETYDYSPNSGTVRETLNTSITSASSNATQGVDITLTSPSLPAQAAFRYGNSLNLTDGQFDSWYESEFDYIENIASNVVQQVGIANASTFNATTAIPANSIALATSASSSNDIYNGYILRLTKYDADGVPYVQERVITDYIGSEKVAILDNKWDASKTPEAGDSYEILSPGDKRVSINPSMQLLDYLTSNRYGKGLSLQDDIALASFQDSARLCDTRSDVHVAVTGSTPLTVGDVYEYEALGGRKLFQGTIKSSTYRSSTGFTEVVFENVVGKLGRKWEDWKSFTTGDLLWKDGVAYRATSNGTIANPAISGAATILGVPISKVSGSGPSSILVNVSTSSFDGNPLVKAYSDVSQTFSKGGYELYDSDDVKYWRYVGWDAQEQRYVTRHQTNFVIDTSKPVFDNINGMLNHFNGILRYSSGRYELDIESTVGVLSEVQYIDNDDIIGAIKVTDSGQKGVYNSVSAAIPDPQNRFDNRTVTFFNSQYLKEDRGVPKQGNFNLPGVTNYFNARINVKQFLDQSRYSLSINFTMMPKGTLLLAGSLISITYPRFGWSNKLFRISNLSFTSDCLVQVSAEEHNNDSYIVSGFDKEYYNNYEPTPITIPTPAAPSNLVATDDERGGITLTWTNGSNFNSATFVTEIWRNSTNDRSSATLLGVTKGTTFLDSVTTEGAVTRYYWVRHSVSVLSQLSSQAAPREIFSPWYPLSETGGESGTSLALLDGINITLSRPVVALASDTEGVVSDFGGSGTDITVTQGTTKFEYDGSGPPAANTFSVTATSPGNVITFDPTPTTVNDGSGNPTIRRYDDITAMSATAGAVVFTVTVNFGNSLSTDFTITQSLSKVSQGVDGIGSRTVNLTASDQSIEYSAAGTSPSPATVTITATALNTEGTPYYEFFVNGSSVQNTTANEYNYTSPANSSSLPVQIEVHLREGSSSSTVLSRDQISLFGIKPAQSAISAVLSNEAHVLFETESGTIDYVGSGTSIEVFEGNTPLFYDNSASPPNGTFKVTAAGTNITVGNFTYGIDWEAVANGVLEGATGANPGKTLFVDTTISGRSLGDIDNDGDVDVVDAQRFLVYSDDPSNNTQAERDYIEQVVEPYILANSSTYAAYIILAVYEDHSNITSDSAKVTYTITATRADGTTETITRVQSLTKVQEGAAARNVTLTVDDQSISYNTNGASPNPSSITFTATARNMQDTAYYEFFVSGSSVQASSTTNTYGYTVPTAFTSLPVQVRVDVREGSASGTVIAQDFVTVIGTKPGENAITIILTNEAHTLPTTNTGAVTYSGSGTDIQVFEGNTQLTVDQASPYGASTFRVSASGSNITVGAESEPNTNTVRFADHSSMVADTATVTYTIDVVKADGTSQTFTRVQSLSKAIQGDPGDPGDPGADGLRTVQGYLYYEKTTSGAPAAPAGNTYTFSTGVVSGTDINDAGTTDIWKNTPNVQDPTSTNTHYTIRYYGTEASAGATTITVAYSDVVQYTNFTGVVTFSGGTFSQGGSAVYDTTTIDGGVIKTGAIKGGSTPPADANSGPGNGEAGAYLDLAAGKFVFGNETKYINWDGTDLTIGGSVTIGGTAASSVESGANAGATAQQNDSAKTDGSVGGWKVDSTAIYSGATKDEGTEYTAAGITLNSTGEIHTPYFYSKSTGAGFKGTVTIGTTDLTADNTLNENTTAGQVGLGNVANKNEENQLKGAFTANTTIGEGYISSGKTAYDSATAGWYLGYNSTTPVFGIGNDSNYVTWNGTALAVKGTITVGSTNLTETNTLNENTTKGNVGLDNVENETPAGQLQRSFALETSISAGEITVGNITIDGANGRIVISD